MDHAMYDNNLLYYNGEWLIQCSSKAKGGAKQGDPLSPYLFVLLMEFLTRSLKTLRSRKDFKFYPRCQKQHIIQLSFDDDLFLFSIGDLTSITLLYACFQEFSRVSGLIANQAKRVYILVEQLNSAANTSTNRLYKRLPTI